jgi:formamidopyrimidine-DNA glycosylase
MPELPEVETVRTGLTPAMVGFKITKVDVNRPDLRWPLPKNMAARLAGTTVLNLRRRSKYILADLSSEETLLIHLGMSGRIQVSGSDLGQFHRAHPPRDKHDHVVFYMDNEARVAFNDPRRFGAMDLAQTRSVEDHKFLINLGPEPLGNTFNEAYLADRLKARKLPIKSALLDQKLVAGLGNIYVCEALYRAGISPTRRSDRISRPRIAGLVPHIKDVLSEAIQAGGSSLRDHRQADGELGYFQHSFAVYDQEGSLCTTKGCHSAIQRIVQSGRSSFYCPTCQK